MLKRAARRDETITFLRAGSYLTFGEENWSPIFSLCTTLSTFLMYEIWNSSNSLLAESETLRSNQVQLGFPSLLIPAGETHIKIVSEWIRSCDTQHPRPDTSFIPTRLLRVGDLGSRRVQLACHLGEKLKSVEYVALSHRWGTPDQKQPEEVKFASTTFDNINKIREPESIDEAILPRTFRDAVILTRKLGKEYLWIDSLCILQKKDKDGDPESKADWEKESKLMEQVFSSAYFTIAASCADHRFDGFLKPRAPRQYVTLATDEGAQFHVCDVIDQFDVDVEQGELNKRGWVLQERALSRRTIHLTKTQTYWECGDGVRCETFTQAKK